jgi:hypothetical protein
MPNDCWNKITIKANNEQIKQMLLNDFGTIPSSCYQEFIIGKEAFIFRLWSAWRPNKEFMNNLFDKYEGIWIKNIWQEEGGQSGIIVGTKDDLQEIEWTEGCEEEWSSRLEEVNMPNIVLANDSE